MPTDTAKAPVRLADYRPPDYLIDRVELDINLHLTRTRVRSRLAIRPNPAGVTGAPLVLDGDGLKSVAASLDGTDLRFDEVIASPDKFVLQAPPQRPFTLAIETVIDPSANTQLMGLYRSGSAYCTQCEAEGFRRITYFLDRPDVLSVYTTRIEGDLKEAPVLLGNGNPIESGELDGGRHYAIWHDPHPKPSYLFALVGGDLGCFTDTFVTMSGRKVDLGIYVEHGKEDRAAYAMDALKRSMQWDEEAFGREYDLDVFNIVAVSDFNMGAMENKGLNIFNDKYVLALPETATDADYANIEAIIAHEYFHNWTGNRITCRDWFQLCLKEGLTVFRDQEFSSDQRSRAVKRIADVRALRAAQFTEDAGPLAHNVRPELYHEINNFYTPTVYEKGAEVIRVLKTLLGEAAFRRGMDLYFERCDGTAATVEQFVACFAEASGRDLSQFMRWYSQAGTPVVRVASQHDAQKKTLTVDFAQSTPVTPGQPEKLPVVIPVRLGLIGENGHDIPLATGKADVASEAELANGVIELKEPARRVVFTGVATKPTLSLLRGFSAPVRIEAAFDPADLLRMLAHDADTFNRWQAAQTYGTRLLIDSANAIRQGRSPAEDSAFVDGLGRILDDAAKDAAFAALALSLPGDSDIAREIGTDVDPDAIHAARKALRVTLGKALGKRLLHVYESLDSGGAFSPDAASAGRRSLRHVVLDLYAAGDPQAGAEIAMHQFSASRDMTNRFAALAVLSLIPGDTREHALDSFFRAYASDPLVIDKWFALQAMIPEAQTLARVKALMEHHAFSFGNPNRLRSLVGTFAMANPTQFNAADGSGYEFMADLVAKLDSRNPQVAARLLIAFKSWRNLEGGRRALAEAALRRVQTIPQLSPDVRDIVERSLA